MSPVSDLGGVQGVSVGVSRLMTRLEQGLGHALFVPPQ